MKLRVLCAATVVLSAIAASASAGEVSKSTLSSMGLGQMQQLSDNDGLAVRGMGLSTSASVWGAGTANYLGQTSTNGYTASATNHHGSSNAAGGNVSFGGVIHGFANNNGFAVHGIVGIAGGTSFATAH